MRRGRGVRVRSLYDRMMKHQERTDKTLVSDISIICRRYSIFLGVLPPTILPMRCTSFSKTPPVIPHRALISPNFRL